MYVVAEAEARPACRVGDAGGVLTDADYLIARMRNEMARKTYLADAYPSLAADLGPGSLALYLGTEPRFAWDTVWYDKSIKDLKTIRRWPSTRKTAGGRCTTRW
jgi:5-methyltetrahydrofolate--homocysteine methyltransferase